MKPVVEKAQKQNRNAMTELYIENRKRVFFLCNSILQDSALTEDATIFTFKNIWEDLKQSKIVSREHFTYLCVKRAYDYCKRLIIKKDSKSLRIPNDKNFSVAYTKIENKENIVDTVLFNLNNLQRIIFVLDKVGNYNNNQLADATKMDLKTIDAAKASVETNIERILNLAEYDKGYDGLLHELEHYLSKTEILEKIDYVALAAIDFLAHPIERKNKITLSVTAAIAVVVVVAIILGIIGIKNGAATSTDSSSSYPTSSDISSTDQSTQTSAIDQLKEKTYYADIDIKNYGKITLALDGKSAPITVENFVSLAKSGFYNGLTFHRIMEDFMMQGGDPEGTGYGGSDKEIKGEFAANGVNNTISHLRGVISMARSGNSYDSGSSQFFIVHKDSTFLDGQYAAFGCVTEGMDVVDKICTEATPTDDNGTIPAANQPKINTITIREAK